MNDLKKVMTDRNIHIISKAIYSYLNGLSGDINMCYPCRGKMAFDLNINVATLDKYMKELVYFGYVEVQKNEGKWAIY